MKKAITTIIFIAMAAQTLLVQGWAAEGVLPQAQEEMQEHDGFLVGLSENAPVFASEDMEFEYVVPGVIKVDELSAVAQYIESGLVEYIEPNCYASLADGEEPGEAPAEEPPNDWAYQAMHAPAATQLGLTGAGVRVAVIDSGIDKANIDLPARQVEAGHNYISATSADTDALGHGTNAAQMIIGLDNGEGSTGAAPDAVVVSLKCFDAGYKTTAATLAKAIWDAVDVYDCQVINMSWVLNDADDSTIHAAITHACDSGAILVAAAGNVTYSAPQKTVLYPAAYEEVIGVGSVDFQGMVSPTSQQTSAVFVCAPGKDIPAVDNTGAQVTISGTSFASPCVAAAAAAVLQADPQTNQTDFMALLQGRAQDKGDTGYDTSYGYGFVDMGAIFGSQWGIISGSDAIAHGWTREAGAVIAAAYSPECRMTACRCKIVDAGFAPFCLELGAGGDTVKTKLFFTAPNLSPN